MSEEKTRPGVKRMVESIVGCKWSLGVLAMVREGINRPGAMTRHQQGLTTKVLNQRLAKLTRFGILQKQIYPEVPPHVEYHFTPFGTRFLMVLDAIEQLENHLAEEAPADVMAEGPDPVSTSD